MDADFLDASLRAARPPSVALPPNALLNMELSQLAFADRLLDLADDPRTPLLERVRFTAIFGNVLDEFFMTRVAGFKRQVAEDRGKPTLDGISPEQQLAVIASGTRILSLRLRNELVPRLMNDLREAGIEIAGWNVPVHPGSGRWNDPLSHTVELGPLAPVAVPSETGFPHVRNLRPAFLVRFQPDGSLADGHGAILELPGDLPRLLALPGGRRFMPIEEIIRIRLHELPDVPIEACAFLFRVVRRGNLRVDPRTPGDIVEAVARDVASRPFQPVVRLEVEDSMPAWGREFLLRRLGADGSGSGTALNEEDLYPSPDPIDLSRLSLIAEIPVAEHHFPPLRRRTPFRGDQPVLDQIRQGDILVRFPRHTFTGTVDRFLREAGDDPATEEIWVTLYRTSRPSRTVRLLRRAHRRGKAVTALVEVKASFDERQNIEWARVLEADGIRVHYGSPSLKVHAKIASVVRREADGRRGWYSYVSTGNLNAATARAYTDLGILTADPGIGQELHTLFCTLAGDDAHDSYQRLLVAPFNLRREIIRLIERETANARAGRPAGITAKLNGLADRQVIAALYDADRAGVYVDLLVRGICALRPGVPGLSAHIRVVAIAGPFLEHARILRFRNGGSPEYFIGSADLRGRNLSRRVEVAVSVSDPRHRATLDRILREGLHDPDAWDLGPDGRYLRRCAYHHPRSAGLSTLIADSSPADRRT